MTEIPLLSGKPLCDFSPEEYRQYVMSLFKKHVPRRTTKKPLRPYIAKRTKTGKLQIKVNRVPKWISPEEMELISAETAIPLSEIFLTLKKKEILTAEPAK